MTNKKLIKTYTKKKKQKKKIIYNNIYKINNIKY